MAFLEWLQYAPLAWLNAFSLSQSVFREARAGGGRSTGTGVKLIAGSSLMMACI